MDLKRFRRILEKYIRIYNLNRLELEDDTLYINLIYNISKERLEKPVYRNFEASKRLSFVELDILEENLDFIFREERQYRIADPKKILDILDIEKSLKRDYGKAIEEIKEKLFERDDMSDGTALLVLSNDVVSTGAGEMAAYKYSLKIDSNMLYISNLKLHIIEWVDMDRELRYEEMFEVVKEADSLMESILDTKRRKGDVLKEGTVVTKELLEDLNSLEEAESSGKSRLFKSYHHYITNDLNRDKSYETIVYKGEKYEIIKIGGDGYLILKHPEKSILTDDRLIDRIVIKYKMLHGEMA
jgi:hypothetical protein